MKKKRPADDAVTAYARSVVAGDVPVNKQHAATCARHLRDLDEQEARGIRWDAKLAEQAIAFFPRVLRHYKAEWSGQAFTLAPWQALIVGQAFGWMRADGTRRFREVWIEVPRKNGKTSLVAGIGLLLAFFDGESAAEVYCAATKADQARIMFADAKAMVQQSPALRKRVDVFAHSLANSTSSRMTPLGADEHTLDGLNPHGALVDEVHAHKGSGVVDVLKTATGARRQPMIIYTTTAGYDRNSIGWRLHDYAGAVLDGTIQDDSFLAFVACADEGADWRSEDTWRRANPNFGVSVKAEKLKQDAQQAQSVPAWQNRFRRLHLNEWTEQSERAIDVDIWNEGAAPLDLAKLAGRPCWGALDLAATGDLTAFALLFGPDADGAFDVLLKFWAPEEKIRQRSTGGVRFDLWAEAGFITATPGNVTDYDYVERDILETADDFQIRGIAFDRWNASQVVVHLADKLGADRLLEFGQGFASMSAPTKELLRLVSGRRLRHGGNPVLTWMMRNLALRQDPAGNMKPDREKSADKIDGVVAVVMSLGLAIRKPAEPEVKTSIYDDGGIRSGGLLTFY